MEPNLMKLRQNEWLILSLKNNPTTTSSYLRCKDNTLLVYVASYLVVTLHVVL